MKVTFLPARVRHRIRMENRRQHYRHGFTPTHSFVVRLQSPDGSLAVEGELVDLSVGGMCICAPGLTKEDAETWIATLPLDTEAVPLNIPAQRVHRRGGAAAFCGFRFLDAADGQMSEEREKAIWKFLLREQQRRRRLLQRW
jgi:c-di-GMP-binding flagellar brake protein YcgR